jgi:hypothetical protein
MRQSGCVTHGQCHLFTHKLPHNVMPPLGGDPMRRSGCVAHGQCYLFTHKLPHNVIPALGGDPVRHIGSITLSRMPHLDLMTEQPHKCVTPYSARPSTHLAYGNG